jgi:hypothetical protein
MVECIPEYCELYSLMDELLSKLNEFLPQYYAILTRLHEAFPYHSEVVP